jgi:hypothetical protein
MFKKYITDILKDKDHPKFSLTRFAAIGTIILFWIQAGTATYTMYKTQTTDHVLIGEVIGVILTLLGFKTGFGFSANGQTGDLHNDPSGNVINNTTDPQTDSNITTKQIL